MRRIPCLAGWIGAAVCFMLVPVPRFAYVRLVPLALGGVIGAFSLAGSVKRSEVARVIRVLTVWALLVAFCIGTVTGAGIAVYSAQEPPEDLAYLLVLGAGVEARGPSATLQERIGAAFRYLSEHPDTIAVVTGGQGADEPMSEGRCMYEALTGLGIDPERIWIEDRATSTWENLQFSLDIIEARTGERPQRIGVLSNEFHLFRVARQAYDWGLRIDGVPARTEDPERWLHYFIREIAGIWHYLILGGEQG